MGKRGPDDLPCRNRIPFDQALTVAVAGLLVNGLSVFTLGHQNHDHAPEDDHDDDPYAQTAGYGHSHEHDYNLRAAYLHVMADALTSILERFKKL